MADMLEYKCPCCGGAINFDSKLQKMKCPYCDTEFDMETLRQFDEENLEKDYDPKWQAENVQQPEEELDDEDGKLVSYTCESCGGEIIADQTMASSSCPYCGNPVIVMKKLSGTLKPQTVIPFKLDKKEAEKQFAGLFLDLQKKADNSEISTKAIDLRGMLAALKLIRGGLKPSLAVAMGITNKNFDLFEREMVEDIVRTRIPESWSASEVF